MNAIPMTPAMERMSKARAALVIRQPFWGTLALYLRLEEKAEIETCAVDGVTLFFNADFVMGLAFDELIGVIAHEVSHCAYRHHSRRGKRDPGLWNDACDYVINPFLISAGFKLPPGVLFDSAYGKLGAEEVYARRKAKRDAQRATEKAAGAGAGSGQGSGMSGQPQPSGQPGNALGQSGKPPGASASNGAGAGSQSPSTKSQPGSGAGAANSPASSATGSCPWGKVLDAAKAHEVANIAALDAEWGVRVRQAMAVAKKKHAGHLPGDLERLAEDIAKPSKIDWREHLRQFINDKVTYNYTWTRPNKRFPDMILPGHIVDNIAKIGVVNDTSGSINDTAQAAFSAELKELMDTGSIAELIVVHCDAAVKRIERFTMGEEVSLKAKGGGGTRFAPALKWFEDNEPDVAAILYFTDLECNDFGPEPSPPVMWIAYGFESNINRRAKMVPFGEVVHLSTD